MIGQNSKWIRNISSAYIDMITDDASEYDLDAPSVEVIAEEETLLSEQIPKWWEDEPRAVLTKAYHSKRQLPPKMDKKRWQAFVSMLQRNRAAPEATFKKWMAMDPKNIQKVTPEDKDRIQKAMKESKFNSQKDMLNKQCDKCKKGKFKETSVHDDMDGTLHCSHCNKKIQRHARKSK